jgi:hypothetical protein
MIERGWPTWGCYLAIVPPALFALDMVWENTALSWNHGPQMIGFTLMHTVGILLFPAILASLIWIVISLVAPIFKTRKWRLSNLFGALGIIVLLGIASLPYGFWVGTFASRIAKGPHASEFLVYMAALGELSAVKALLEQGVPVNSPNREGRTAIQAAQNAKQPAVREYLATQGAK